MPENVATPLDAWETQEIHSAYEVVDRAAVEHVFTHKTVVQTVFPQRFYERRFRWTGSSSTATMPEVLSATDGHTHAVHGPTYVEEDWTYYLIDIGFRVPPKKPITIETRHALLDENKTFKPYLHVLARQALKLLTLSVTLPSNQFHQVRPTRRNAVSGHPYAVDDLDFRTEDRTAILTVENPEVGDQYGISWL